MVAHGLREALWEDGAARGERWSAFIEGVVGTLADKAVLDVGCANGGITRVLARRAGRTCGVDNRWENVQAAQAATTAADGPALEFVRGDASALPFSAATFDVTLMSGLLEWMPWALPDRSPRAAQLDTLRELHRVMVPGARLFVGIENRWFPRFLLRSPHQHLPLVLLWPAGLAWRLPRWVYGERVRERLYGPWGLGRLLREAGFHRVEVFIPVFDYQFPRAIVHGRDSAGLLAALRDVRRPPRTEFEALSSGGPRGWRWMRLIARLGLQRWLAPCFIVVGERDA